LLPLKLLQIAMAKFLTNHLKTVKPFFETAASQITQGIKAKRSFKALGFSQSNAEDTKLPARSFDLVTVMWALHEAPLQGRAKIIKEALCLLSPGGTLAVIDISTDYVPSEEMLMGEPYVQEYQQNIHRQLKQSKGFVGAEYRTIVPNHLGMWTLTRSAAT
jgi:ubiquinone/menaquinone biosynthesis C-methylase UbiE